MNSKSVFFNKIYIQGDPFFKIECQYRRLPKSIHFFIYIKQVF